jgi:hypothetical protein
LVACLAASGTWAVAQQKRARPPRFDDDSYRSVFYDDVVSRLNGQRPRIGELRSLPNRPAGTLATDPPEQSGGGDGDKWRALTDAVHLEDEVKRLVLRYDGLVTTPGRFRSGDFQEASDTLAMLATVFAVISEYEGEIRFQEDAAIARDLMARAVQGTSSGSSEAFAEAKQRKADLQDIVRGSGLNRSAPVEPNDWALITTRSALMEYLETTLDSPLQSGTNNPDDFEDALDDLRRAAAMVAVVGQVLTEEGMDEADDPDYCELSLAMTRAALDLRAALQQQDAEAARLAVGQISQSCSDCHNQYR